MTFLMRHRMTVVCLVGLGASIAIAGLELGRYSRGQDLPVRLGMAGMLLLIFASAGAIWIHRRSVRDGLRLLSQQLRELRAQGQWSRLLVDRSPASSEVVRPLSTCVDELRREMDELRSSNCSLDVRHRIADARRQQMEAILRRSSDVVLVINRFEELVFLNDAAAETFDLNLATALRRRIDRVIEDTAVLRELRQTLSSARGGVDRVVEISCHARDQQRTFRVLLQRLGGSVAGHSCVAMTMRDISNRSELEQTQMEFVSSVSHELKTPLASLKAYTEMLLDDDIEDPQQKHQCYVTMARETDRLANMIERLLNLSRLQSIAGAACLEPVSMTAVLRQVLSVLAPQANAKNLRLHEKLPPVFYQVEADYDMLCQAMLNLVGNAIKYTPEGGEISVIVTPDKKRRIATIEVADTGIGIEAEELPRIFEKFYRVRSTKHMAPGTGLGLALTKYIIETIHRSQLSVTSEVGQGATFSFQLAMVL